MLRCMHFLHYNLNASVALTVKLPFTTSHYYLLRPPSTTKNHPLLFNHSSLNMRASFTLLQLYPQFATLTIIYIYSLKLLRSTSDRTDTPIIRSKKLRIRLMTCCSEASYNQGQARFPHPCCWSRSMMALGASASTTVL